MASIARGICKRQDRIIVILFSLYCVFVLLYYISVFAINPGSVISRQANQPVAPTAPSSPLAPSTPANSSGPVARVAPTGPAPSDTPTGINGGITIGILLYFLGLGAPAFGILGMFVVLLGIRERQRQFVSCCLFCLLPFLLVTWIFATAAEIAFVSPETAGLNLPSPVKGGLLLLATIAGLLIFLVIFTRGMCIRESIGDANEEHRRANSLPQSNINYVETDSDSDLPT